MISFSPYLFGSALDEHTGILTSKFSSQTHEVTPSTVSERLKSFPDTSTADIHSGNLDIFRGGRKFYDYEEGFPPKGN